MISDKILIMACEVLQGTEGKLLSVLLFQIAILKTLSTKAKKLLLAGAQAAGELDHIKRCFKHIQDKIGKYNQLVVSSTFMSEDSDL